MNDEQIRSYDSVRDEVEKPAQSRTEILNRRKKLVVPRKHHMTSAQMYRCMEKFQEEIKDVSTEIKDLAGSKFFNPFRSNGVYFGCIQSLYLLGANKWHAFSDVRGKVVEVMSNKEVKGENCWDKFDKKSPRLIGGESAITAKDSSGRIRDNFRTLQRSGGLHPYSKKLEQVGSCINIKRTEDGTWCYMLDTNFTEGNKPIFDDSAYVKPKRVKRRINTVALPEEEAV
jgi:hypothetical protein